MRTCVYCETPLPEPARKGGRRKEFCNDACKNRHYREYKKIKLDADLIADPCWEKMYMRLYDEYIKLGSQSKDKIQILGERCGDFEKAMESARYWRGLYDDIRVDYAMRMKALGISEKDIKEFNEYWLKQQVAGPAYVETLHN